MSFFGFEQHDLEKEKRAVLEGGLHETEDVAVYTWGEESYDGLGDALQEGGDDFNDETFGGNENIGKDFDFSSPALPVPAHEQGHEKSLKLSEYIGEQALPQQSISTINNSSQSSRSTKPSLEAIWDDKSPFSVLPRVNGAGRSVTDRIGASPSANLHRFSANESPAMGQKAASHTIGQGGVRTLQEIEAEMLAAAQHSRGVAQLQQQQQDRQLQRQLQQEQLAQQEQLLLQQETQLNRQRLQFQQDQLQFRGGLRDELIVQQQRQHQHQRTPPPRMLPAAQSPRFHEHERQRQILLLQQQQEQQQQQRLLEIKEHLRVEELERHLRAQKISQITQGPGPFNHQRQQSGPSLLELQALQNLQSRRQRSQSPNYVDPQFQVPLQQSMAYLPQSIQLQQRLLSEMAQSEFLRDLQGATHAEQEALRAEALRKIVEAERMEDKRRRRATKIAHMARYNDLMTQSDKDFITRIQVSQLVTQDPYAEDFYAQVYGAILRSRLGLQTQDERVLKFGSGGGIGLGLGQKGGGRRQNAMQRMEAQVERIVSNARIREKEKGLHSLHSLQGALGKTSGRSYKAAPRQLLQVDSGAAGSSPTLSPAHAHISKEDAAHGAAREAAKLGREALGNAADTDGLVRKDPLSQRQILVILENLYDLVLKVEQLRRDQPPPEEEVAFEEWNAEYNELVDQLWVGLRVMVPLETSDPHPFISLLAPTKGKRLLPRLTRHLSNQQMLTLLTLLVACFSQLDVVTQGPLLDSPNDTRERQDADRQTQAFLGSVLQSILPIVAKASLRLISGLLGLLLDRSDIVIVSQTKPGLALLTLFLSRVEVIKQSMSSITDVGDLPSPEEAQQWELMFNHLFQLLAPHLIHLFPSIRSTTKITPGHPNGTARTDMDQPVWQFLAALALHAVTEQHQILVTALREKVLDDVVSANKGWGGDEGERQTKLANVNLFLHALGLDSSQIAL